MKRFLPLLAATVLSAGLLVGFGSQALAQGTPLVVVPRRADPNQLISFSFRQADIDDVLRFLADASGKIVFKDSSVVTSVTITNQSRIPVAQASRLVGQFLALKGYALVETPEALIVTTREQGIQGPTKVSAGRELAAIPEGREIITHIIPLLSADAVRLREELTPLFPATGHTRIISHGDTNSLVIVGEADNVRRILQLVLLLDRSVQDEITVEVIRLKVADATEMARYLTELFRPETNQGAAPQPQPGQPGQPGGAAGGRSTLAQLRGRVRFAADTRSNSLIVYASPANIRAVKELVEQLDVNLTPRTEYRIIPLQYAD